MKISTKKDSQLAKLAAQGDQAALENLIEQNLRLIYGFTYSFVHNQEDASDLTQETFVKVWKNLQKFDPNKSFRPWLYQIAKNVCLDFLKKKSALAFSDLDTKDKQRWLAESLADAKPGPVALTERTLTAGRLTLAIKKLKPKYAHIVALRHGQELSFSEIAATQNEPLNTVKSRYRRAVIMLKKILLP